mgnify:CR=1 FL=1
MITVAVIGGGSWGTAFAQIAADAGHRVVLWARDPQIVDAINAGHENPVYHPGIVLPTSVIAVHDVPSALADADVVILAIPVQTMRASLEAWGQHIPSQALVVSLAKGLEQKTDLRVTEVIHEVTGIPRERIGVLSGPNLAGEIVLREPAATTVACIDESNARRLQEICSSDYFRAFYSTDVIGVEIAGATKNVIALAAGVIAGMNLGENAQAAIATRGLAEMTKLGVALGAQPTTFLGLAGVGDLVATCASPLSRNRSFGVHIGEGMSVAQVMESTRLTCEAVKSCEPIVELAKANGVEMPISELVVEMVHHGLPAHDMVAKFLASDVDDGAEL